MGCCQECVLWPFILDLSPSSAMWPPSRLNSNNQKILTSQLLDCLSNTLSIYSEFLWFCFYFLPFSTSTSTLTHWDSATCRLRMLPDPTNYPLDVLVEPAACFTWVILILHLLFIYLLFSFFSPTAHYAGTGSTTPPGTRDASLSSDIPIQAEVIFCVQCATSVPLLAHCALNNHHSYSFVVYFSRLDWLATLRYQIAFLKSVSVFTCTDTTPVLWPPGVSSVSLTTGGLLCLINYRGSPQGFQFDPPHNHPRLFQVFKSKKKFI